MRWPTRRRIVWIVAEVGSLDFLLNSVVALRSARWFEFGVWLMGAGLVFVLAGLAETVKVAEGE